SKVLFPLPLSPRSTVVRSRGISSERGRTAGTPPKLLDTSRRTSTASGGPADGTSLALGTRTTGHCMRGPAPATWIAQQSGAPNLSTPVRSGPKREVLFLAFFNFGEDARPSWRRHDGGRGRAAGSRSACRSLRGAGPHRGGGDG